MDNDSTGKPARLSLAQRAACGLPIDLSRKAGLDIDDVCWLEHPDDAAQQARLCAKLETAIGLYPRLARPFSIGGCPAGWLIRRSAYRAWRTARSPSSLLSETSDITLWLGATPGPEPAESIPPVETSLPELPTIGGIALVEAENAALVALRKALKREPDFEEFWDYLTNKDETGTVADFTDNRLDWIGKSGKSCSTSRRSFRNRLTAAKKRNPFTPS